MTMLKNRPPRMRAGSSRRSVPGRRTFAFLLLVLSCWVTLLIALPSSSGNPVLRATSPGNTETVKSPGDVQLTFDQPVPAGLATVRIINPPGEQVIFDRPVNPPGRPDTISVPMPQTRFGGTYTVAWSLPSDQLEPLRGAFTFDVFQPSQSIGVPEIEARHDPVIAGVHTTARIVAVAAMAVLIGAAFFVVAIWPAGVRSRTVRRVIKYSWIGLVTATLAVIATFGPYTAWVPLSDAFEPGLFWETLTSEAGVGLLSRLLMLVPITVGIVALMASVPVEQQRDRLVRGSVVVGCSAALASTWSLARPHPAGAMTAMAFGVDVVLLMAVAISVTGLGMLWLLLRDEAKFAPYATVSRWYRTAGACTGLLVLAGAWHVWRLLDGSEPATTSFAWLTGGLVALVALLTGVAVAGRAFVHGHFVDRDGTSSESGERQVPDAGRFRKLVAGGAGAAVLISGATALLVATQPPNTAHAQRITSIPAAVQEQSPPFLLPFDNGKPGGKGAVDLVLMPEPDEAGRLHLSTRVSIRGENGADRDDMTVTAALERPRTPSAPVPLSDAGPGYSVGSATMPGPGEWALVLTLRAPDGSQQTVTQNLDVR